MNGPSRSHRRNILVLLALVAALASVASGAPVSLTNGVPLTGLSGTTGSETFYAIVVPAGQDELEISISGSTGDCDLYVRRNAAPTTTSYDYRPYEIGSNETVTVESPAGGTWYIMLRGYTAYSNLTLLATYSASVSIIPLTNDVPVTGLSGATGTEVLFSINVPNGQTKLQIAISGGTGDCDLYVKRGAVPTTSDYDYRPFLPGNEETVTVNSPTGGTWYIMLKGYSAYSGLTLLASYGGGVGTLLENGVPVTGLTGTVGSETIFRINVPAGQTNLEISTSGGTGDCDLYVKYGARPTTSSWDYRPFLAGNNETVSVATPTGGTWYIMVRGYAAYSGVTVVASYGEAITLQDDVPVPNLSGALNSTKYYKIQVPSGQTDLEVKIFGGTGNCDLYVKRGSKPTVSSYDYRPYLSGNTETVAVSNPQAGTWYIMLRARQAYSGVTLLADYWFTGTVTLLTNGVPVTGIAGSEGSEKFYRIIVPSGRTELVIETSGGTGDADLYVKLGSPPTTTDYDYRPYQLGNNEKVTIENPPSGNWLIMIRGYHAYSGLTLVATHKASGGSGGVTELTNGVPVTGLAGATDTQAFYKIEVPSGQASLEIAMSGGTGDADMYVRRGSQPTLSEWDYRPYLMGNNETVTVANPAAGTWFIMINAYVAYANVSLVASYIPIADPVTTLTNGVPVTNLGAPAGNEDFYKIVVPAGQDYLNISISGGTGDCDLYVKKGAKPTTSSWDYRPYLIGNNETVEVANPAAATWYIMLRSYQTYAGMTLVATYGSATLGNDFSTDPHCKALWRFEPGELATDSIGSNTLTPQSTPIVDTGDVQEGDGSCDLTDGTFLIDDADLDAGFPLKSGDTNKNISVAFWMKGSYGQNNATGGVIFGKGGVIGGKYSFLVAYRETAGPGSGTLSVQIGIYGGINHDKTYPAKIIQRDQWYHVAVTYEDQGATGTVRVRIYDPSDDSVYETVETTIEGIHVSDGPVKIGTYRYSSQTYTGLVDELVVFDDILTPNEIDLIRQGSYGKP